MRDPKRNPYGRGIPEDSIWEVPEVKARMFRAATTAALLAAVVQSLGAAVKW